MIRDDDLLILFGYSVGFNVPKACSLYTTLPSQTKILYISSPSAIKLLLIISRRISKSVNDTPLPLRGSGEVVARHISIIIVIIAIPLGSPALPLALRVRLLSSSGAADGFWLLAGWWRSEMVICCGSWDSGF